MGIIDTNVKLAGEYRMVISRDGNLVHDTGWFPNLILNQGLDRIGSTPSNSDPIFWYCRVGTGSSTPVITQTALDAQIGFSAGTGSAISSVNSGTPVYSTLNTYQCIFAQGAVVGNIAEVGMGWATTGNTLFSRALILNNLGNPISIPIVALDQLTVYYRITVIPDLSDSTGSVVIGGTPYNFTTRVANVGGMGSAFLFQNAATFNIPVNVSSYTAGATLGSITAAGITGTLSGIQGYTTAQAPYTLGTYYRDGTYNWSINDGNSVGGIQGIVHNWGQTYQPFRFQTVFDAPIPKTNTRTMSLTFRFSWNRV